MTDVIKRKYRFPLDIQLFAEDDPEPGNDPNPEPTFTQAELDAKIAERLGRERKKYADYDELKTKLADLEAAETERQKATMTEQERTAAELAAAKQAAADADTARQAALKSANERLLKAEFKIAAAAANVLPDAIEDAYLLADKSGVTVGDDGSVTGVAEAIAALTAAKPFLIATNTPKPIGGPSNPKPDERKTLETQLEDAKKRKDFSKVIELSNKLANLK
ncbi:phage scaffolding protein [Paenibacillus sp. CAU 1782]